MTEHFPLLFFMVFTIAALVIITAIGVSVISHFAHLKRKSAKPIIRSQIDDLTPVEVSMHGHFKWLITSWGRVKQDYLFTMTNAEIQGIAHALASEGAWSGTVADNLIALKRDNGL